MRLRIRHRRPKTHPHRLAVWALLFAGFALIQLVGANPAKAQDIPSETLTRWETTARAAETQLGRVAPILERLEILRATLSQQRTAALNSQDGGKARIERLTNQLEALGPAPEEGIDEAADVAARRAQLEQEITKARAPTLAAEEAYRRADGLIREIDARLRADFTRRLIARQPTPLLPEHWLTAASESRSYLASALGEAGRRLEITRTREAILPVAILTLFGLFLLAYLRPRLLRNFEALAVEQTLPQRRIWTFSLLNFLRFLVPLFAAVLLIEAFELINLIPLSAPGLDQTLYYGAGMLCAAYWLASSLFSPRAPSLSVSGYSNPKASRLWRIVMLLGLIPGATALTGFFSAVSDSSIATRPVLQFPVTLLGAFLLFWFCTSIRPRPRKPDPDESTPAGSEPIWRLILSIISRMGRIAAILAPIAAAIGYFEASLFLLIPPILSIGVLSVCFVLFDLFQRGIDSWIARHAASEGEPTSRLGLLPVLAGFGIICLALPVLALIWGARVSDLTELWVYLRDGIQIGNSRISVTDFLSFALVFGIGYTITRFLQTLMRGTVMPRTRLDAGGQNAVVSGIGYIGFFLAAVLAISATGLDLSNLAIVAGALSVGVGFGLQTIVSNFVSGIILLIERPIKIGDWIEVGGQSGYVQSINVRSTEIQTFDRASVIVPNADLIAGTVLNWTHSSMAGRVIVRVGVAYGTDVRLVEKILTEIAEAHPMVLRRPAPSVVFMGFGADSLDFEIRAILRDVNFMLSARSDMNFEIVRRFAEENIEIPFAQREITIKNPEALSNQNKTPQI